jgi:hypothetical protein
MPRRGLAQFVEAQDFVDRHVVDAEFLRSGDVADPAALFEVRRGAGEGRGVRVCKRERAAGEIRRAIAAQVERHRPGEAREPQAAGDAAAHGVVEFAAEDLFADAPGHGYGSLM